ncbi:MAG TPA: helix-hairpin-helix domain-containing protein [Syntrophales bacterium]|nr:helix-hairpin-helix domain-containing protein [Syntrophales bacterium]HPQ44415.1 helix-hairpin-helix domain-containing protein [Syntrophales bacterium]
MKEKTLVRRQLYGAITIVVVMVLGYVVRDILRYVHFFGTPAICCEHETTDIIVELSGDENHDGFYFLPSQVTVHDLFEKEGMGDIGKFRASDLTRVLHSGDRIVCDRAQSMLTVGDIAVPARLALGMPIDLNGATAEDLVLIPGIGRKTALAIVEMREEAGGFSKVDSLKQINGMGAIKFNSVREYLYIRTSYP